MGQRRGVGRTAGQWRRKEPGQGGVVQPGREAEAVGGVEQRGKSESGEMETDAEAERRRPLAGETRRECTGQGAGEAQREG